MGNDCGELKTERILLFELRIGYFCYVRFENRRLDGAVYTGIIVNGEIEEREWGPSSIRFIRSDISAYVYFCFGDERGTVFGKNVRRNYIANLARGMPLLFLYSTPGHVITNILKLEFIIRLNEIVEGIRTRICVCCRRSFHGVYRFRCVFRFFISPLIKKRRSFNSHRRPIFIRVDFQKFNLI